MKNKFLKIFEDFKDKSFPSILKKICNIIRKDILKNGDNSYQNNYNIDGIDVNIIIYFSKNNKQPYYADVNVYDIISNNTPINIKVNVIDYKIDINYVMSIISHELRHVYDIYTIVDDVEMKEFVKILTIIKHKGNSFVDLVYLSLEHELIARHNMLYELYRWIDITDKKTLMNIFKKSYTHNALIKLKSFDHISFIENNKVGLDVFTLNFSKSIGDKYIDVYVYYKKWEEFFHGKSDEFLGYVDSMLDNVIDDVNNKRIYERMNGYISYNEDIGMNVTEKLFEKMLKFKNNNTINVR